MIMQGKIKKIFADSNVTVNSRVHERIINDSLAALGESHKVIKPLPFESRISRFAINFKALTKIAAEIAFVAILAAACNAIGTSIDGSSVAFGKVIGYFQNHTYTFDLNLGTPSTPDDETYAMHAMVWELGRIRVDGSLGAPVGEISSISDLNTGRTLLLLHQNRTATTKMESFLNKNLGYEEIIALCSHPIANLWNLRDGREQKIGEKDIDGNVFTGFEVFQVGKYYRYKITIWANAKSGIPDMVEVLATPVEESKPSLKWKMSNFKINARLSEDVFSLRLPNGYKLEDQEYLENPEEETEHSAEAGKIVQMLELWAQDKKDGRGSVDMGQLSASVEP
jgi:hypothetical protein